jgi:hypothetical protein
MAHSPPVIAIAFALPDLIRPVQRGFSEEKVEKNDLDRRKNVIIVVLVALVWVAVNSRDKKRG